MTHHDKEIKIIFDTIAKLVAPNDKKSQAFHWVYKVIPAQKEITNHCIFYQSLHLDDADDEKREECFDFPKKCLLGFLQCIFEERVHRHVTVSSRKRNGG